MLTTLFLDSKVQFKDMRRPPQPSWIEIFLFGTLMSFCWLSMRRSGHDFAWRSVTCT